MGNVREGSVAFVEEELAGPGLVAHEKVEKTVVVDIGPHRRLGIGRFRQTALFRNIREGPVAIVAKQRFALRHVARLPCSAQNQNVGASIVVVVGLHQVQAAQLVGEAGFSGLVGESPVSVVMEKVHRLAGVVGRCNDVEQAVILEIVDDYAGSHRKQIQPCLRSHIGEASDALGRIRK